MRGDIFVRLACDDSVETFCVINVCLRLQLDVRANVADDARIAIYLLEANVLHVEACRCRANGDSRELVIGGVFGRLVTNAVQRNVVCQNVVIRILIFVDGNRAAGVSLNAFANGDGFYHVANYPIVGYRSVGRCVTIYSLFRVRVARARYANVDLFRFVGVRGKILFYGRFGGLDYRRICVVRYVVTGGRANLDPFFGSGRRATICRRVGVHAGCVSRLGESVSSRVLQGVRRCSVLYGDYVGDHGHVFQDVDRLAVVLLRGFQVLFDRVSRAARSGSFERSKLEGRLVMRYVIRCGGR